jgi:hypothetical protein
MKEDADLDKARALIVKDLGIDLSAGGPTLQELTRLVSVEIDELLRHDMSRLMSILYRVDVSEQNVKKAFAGTPAADLPMVLAALIVERELQKIDSRKRFSGREGHE